MSDIIAKSATDDDDEDYDCFTKADLVTVTRIEHTSSKKTKGKVLTRVRKSYRIDATIAGKHVSRCAPIWGSETKSNVCVKSYLYPSHLEARDPTPTTETTEYRRKRAPARHRLGDPLKYRPLKKCTSSIGDAGSQPAGSGVGDEGSAAENEGSQERTASQHSGVQIQNEEWTKNTARKSRNGQRRQSMSEEGPEGSDHSQAENPEREGSETENVLDQQSTWTSVG